MKKLSNNLFMLALLTLMLTPQSYANESVTQTIKQQSFFEIRADGLACPYCAYGIEKKFMAIKGVRHVDVDLKKGLVKVSGIKSLAFEEKQLSTLFTDSGFTYRSMKKVKPKKDNKQQNTEQ